MTEPNFFVIGAAKCGTTSICDLLGEHPDVFMTTPKEPHFLSRLTRYNELRSWYDSLYEDAQGCAAVGEGSTSYTHPHRIDFIVPRIRTHYPDARLVYVVRHPVRRLESDWKMRLREKRVPASISRAADKQASLITLGLYWKHITKYRKAFSDDQIRVVFLEDFSDAPEQELAELYRHIGVDPDFVPDNPRRKRNAARNYREDGKLASALRQIPGTSTLKRSAPDWAVRLLKNSLTYQVEREPDWDADALELVRGYFREDSRRLLLYCGKPVDYWSFEEGHR